MKDLEIQEQAEKWCEENTDKHGFCDDAEKAFIQGSKWMQKHDKTQTSENEINKVCNELIWDWDLYPMENDQVIDFLHEVVKRLQPSPPKTK